MLYLITEMFSYPFMVRALLVGALIALCAAVLGVTLVLKRYSMIGDGLSHVGFGQGGFCHRSDLYGGSGGRCDCRIHDNRDEYRRV